LACNMSPGQTPVGYEQLDWLGRHTGQGKHVTHKVPGIKARGVQTAVPTLTSLVFVYERLAAVAPAYPMNWLKKRKGDYAQTLTVIMSFMNFRHWYLKLLIAEVAGDPRGF